MFPIFVRKKLILSILQKQKEGNLTDFPSYAESEGFEPPIRLRVYRISSAALSTTQTTFQ